MKSKLTKITIIITFILLTILMLGSNVNGMVDIGGSTYYTKGDLAWKKDLYNGYDGYIQVKRGSLAGNYYCINHNVNLTQYLGDGDSLTKRISDIRIAALGSASIIDKNNSYLRIAVDAEEENALRGTGWSRYSILKGLRLVSTGVPTVFEDNDEAALYAFATHFYQGGNSSNLNGYVQNAIWEWMLNYGNQHYNNYAHTSLYDAAIYYDNVWKQNGKANLQADSNRENASINGSNYIVGPFKIKYNEATYDRIKFSEVSEYSIKDQNGNQITGAQITNSTGSSIMSTIPNNQDFYIKFPYNEHITQVKIDVTVKYIDHVKGSSLDVISYSQQFRFDWEENVESCWAYWHDDECDSSEIDTIDGDYRYTMKVALGYKCDKCPYGGRGINLGTIVDAEGSAVPVGNERTDDYQNMRKIDGTVTYNYATAHLSAPLPYTEEPVPDVETEIDIEGNVWEDVPQGKNQEVNGIKDSKDIELEGIEVRLYRSNGNLVRLTLTDSKGKYSFRSLNPTYKYYVAFTYDGMIYTNTYISGTPEYNTEGWKRSSKGSEIVSERNALNKTFVTINSYPLLYKTSAIFNGTYLTNGYNVIPNERTLEAYKNAVTDKLKTYLRSHKTLADENYISTIYEQIINNSSNKVEAKQVLQYIWDCRINAYAGNQSEKDGLPISNPRVGLKHYPYYNNFVLIDKDGKRLTATDSTTSYNGYRVIYNGQLYINLGLLRRPTTDLELTEDLYETVVSLNGQDETYKYGTFDSKGVKINTTDAQLTQNIVTDDYNYKIDAQTLSSSLRESAMYPTNYAPIQMYATYRINIRNNSTMPTSVNEIVTYIDTKYYSYSDTYTTTSGAKLNGIRGTFIYPNSSTSVEEKNLTSYDSSSFGLSVNTNSKCGTASQTGTGLGTDLYISFDQNIILEQNEVVAIYITYRLGENSTKNSKFNCTYRSTQTGGSNHAYAILQDLLNNNIKINIETKAEINSYSTFFKKNDDIGNTQRNYNSYYIYTSKLSPGDKYRPAGILDALSTPGNLTQVEINNYRNNKGKSEDDWDMASSFVLTDAGKRTLKGNVWETVNEPANVWANSANYPRYNSSYGVEGITVELIEIRNGIEYVRARTTTASDGSYEFTNFIPGIYTVRFTYGDTAIYDTNQYSKYSTFTLNGQQYKCAYNGEFYQSAKANPKTNDNKYWYAVEEGDRYSDAYDEATIRKAVNGLLQTYSYNDEVKLLKEPTNYMVYAYTSLIEIEVEKATESSTSQTPSYTISNIDFALTPRTESKLTINKEVEHLKLILQGGTVQFDADTKTIREQGVPAVVQAKQGNDISISMPSQQVDGATLEITYKITVTNEGPEDSVTYYKDSSGNLLALALYKEDVTKLTYYEGAMRTYNNTNGFQRNPNTTWVSKVISGVSQTSAYNSSKTEKIETTVRANTIADFISNNLNFAKVNYTGATVNNAWDLYTGTKAEFETTYYKQNQNSSEQALKPQISTDMNTSEIYDSNVIVLSNSNNAITKANLKHGESVSEDIVLSKVISVNENSTDKKSYTNKVRVIRMSNSVSKIQDMAGAELTHVSEHVKISDPTGIGNAYLGILLTLIAVTIIGAGIILIKKYAIKRNM